MKMVMGQVLRDRYRFDRELGRRGHVVTWLVTDLKSVTPCVLKVLREADAPPADARLFEAQARVLAGLDNPGLPRFVEHFVLGEGKEREHCFVTRFHPGESLYRLVGKGRMLSEAQAVSLLRRLVPVLAYLHGFDPPLVHRGIKAKNVIVGPDGRPCLTDLHFAVEGEGWKSWEEAAPEAADIPLAAPEVALGGVVPASDIYALGLAVIYAMSGRDPAPLIAQEGGRQRIREATRASEGFAAVLAHMVEPSLEKRYPDAGALEADLARLATGRAPVTVAQAAPPKPAVPSPPPAPVSPSPGAEGRRRDSPLRFAALLAILVVAAALLWLNTARRAVPTGESLLPAPSPIRPSATVSVEAPPPSPAPAEAPDAPASPALPAAPAAPAASATAAGQPAGDAAASAPLPAATPAPAPEPAGATDSPVAVAPAPADAAPVVAEGRLLFDGQPVTRLTSLQPTFWFRNEAKGTPEKPQVDYRDGAFRIRGLPRGRMGMSMRINLEPGNPNLYPGDLDAWTPFVVGEGPPAALDVNLRKIMRLLQPVDNKAVIRGWDEPCGAGSVHPGQVVFAWEPLDPAATYEVTIDRLACGRKYAAAGRAFAAKTDESWVKTELAPSAEGECYSFRLSARKDGRPLGTLTTHGRGGLGWDYRFTVR